MHTTNLQHELCQNKDDEAAIAAKKIVVDDLIEKNNLHKLNDSAMSKLFEGVKVNDEYDYKNLPVKMLKILKDYLDGFAHVRLFDTVTIPKNEKHKMPTNRGTLEGAENGEVNNLVRVCHKVCELPHKLERPEIDDNGNVIIPGRHMSI